MKKSGYFSTGELMKLAHITKKTVRYYDEHGILTPSYIDPSTHTRFYTEDDLARLQQILLFKTLGFSLGDIREMIINTADSHTMSDSLELQLHLVEDRIEQMQVIAQALRSALDTGYRSDWQCIMDQIHNIGMETRMKNQYLDASNITARIRLHSMFSQNKQGWFPWIYEQCGIGPGMRILETGCGDGSFWVQNAAGVPGGCDILLTDISEGMLQDARRSLKDINPCTSTTQDSFQVSSYSYQTADCASLPFADGLFDIVIANHVIFYCDSIPAACAELSRVLKPGGQLVCSTYGRKHMLEISKLAAGFDDRIILAAENLFEAFGRENGSVPLSACFSSVEWRQYADSLDITSPEPLIAYILSCHGNQNQYILDKYSEFRSYIKKATTGGFHVTKDAGIFICKK